MVVTTKIRKRNTKETQQKGTPEKGNCEQNRVRVTLRLEQFCFLIKHANLLNAHMSKTVSL